MLATGVVAGMAGLFFLARIPEPEMPVTTRRPWVDIFKAPLRHREFRPVMIFLASWTFAANLIAPFFASIYYADSASPWPGSWDSRSSRRR